MGCAHGAPRCAARSERPHAGSATSPAAPPGRMLPAMKRAALALVLAACSASSNDFPPLAEGGPPGGNAGGGGTVRDAGIGDGGGDGGVLIAGRVCIVRDLSNPTDCDPNADASRVTVALGTRKPTVGPDRTGAFLIAAPAGSPAWRATGRTFVSSVMPFGTGTTIPTVPDTLYTDVVNANAATILPAGLARARPPFRVFGDAVRRGGDDPDRARHALRRRGERERCDDPAGGPGLGAGAGGERSLAGGQRAGGDDPGQQQRLRGPALRDE